LPWACLAHGCITSGEAPGPLLLLTGSPMDSTGFAPLASTLAGDYCVVKPAEQLPRLLAEVFGGCCWR
jgi:hypothetical protein